MYTMDLESLIVYLLHHIDVLTFDQKNQSVLIFDMLTKSGLYTPPPRPKWSILNAH